MKRRIAVFTLLCLMAVSVFAVSCGGRNDKIPTPPPTPPVSTPPVVEQPTATPNESRPNLFSDLNDLMAAYVGQRPIDQSMTPRALYKKMRGDGESSHNFPRIQAVVVDKDGNPVGELGFGGVALPIERFLVAPAMPDIDTSDLPPPLKEKGARGGVMLTLGERPDGAPDYEIVKRSVARNDKLHFEIFERNPNPRFSFVPALPFEIQDLKDVIPGDPVIFYGYTPGVDGTYYPTEKRGTISFARDTHAMIMVDGSFARNDWGAPVFTVQCGVEKLIGIAGSPVKYGEETQENEAFVFGAREVLKFVEEQTGAHIEVKESKNHCPKADPVARDRAIKALSNGLYDFSYDLCDLKETCGLTKESKWIRPFEEVWVSKKDPAKETVISSGDAFLAGKYVAVPASRAPSARQNPEGLHYNVKYRILWGGSVDGQYSDDPSYEYLTFLGRDNSERVAVFERTSASNFPLPIGVPIKVGKSKDLRAGNVLSGIGALDLRSFSGKQTPDYHRRIERFAVLGVSKVDSEYFYVQGQLRSRDNASALCAWRDGECEFVGFLFAPLYLYSEGAKILNRALTIEFILNAIRQFSDVSTSAGTDYGSTRAQALEDRVRIIELLKDKKPDVTSLLLDQTHEDISVSLEDRAQISILLFDETGARIKDAPGIDGEALILSDTYLLTSGILFPRPIIVSDQGATQKNPDVTSNTLFTDGKKKFEARIALPHVFLDENEIASLLTDIPLIYEILSHVSDPAYFTAMDRSKRQQFAVSLANIFWRNGENEFSSEFVTELLKNVDDPLFIQGLLSRPDYKWFLDSITSKMDIFDVVLIDRTYGYALLKKITPGPLGAGALKKFPVVEKSHLRTAQEITAAYAQGFFGSSYRRIGLVSPGTITYTSPDGSLLALNSFVSREIRGAPIYALCDGALCLAGIITEPYPIFHNEVKTEGFAIPLDFVLEKIKEKTGIDLRR